MRLFKNKIISFIILIMFCVLNSRNFLYAQYPNTRNTLQVETSFPTLPNEKAKIEFIKNIDTTLKTLGMKKEGRKNFWIYRSKNIKGLERILIDLNILNGKEQMIESNNDNDEFFTAINEGNINKIDDVLTKNKNKTDLINMIDPKTNMRPLQIAIIKNDEALIWYLIAQGTDLNIRDARGENIFRKLARENNNIALLEYLAIHNFVPKSDAYKRNSADAKLTRMELETWLDQFSKGNHKPNITQIFKMYHAEIGRPGFWNIMYSEHTREDNNITCKFFLFGFLFFLTCLANFQFIMYHISDSNSKDRKLIPWFVPSIFVILTNPMFFILFVGTFLRPWKQYNTLRQSMIFYTDTKKDTLLDIAIAKKRHDIIWYLAVNYPSLFKQNRYFTYDAYWKTSIHNLVKHSEYLPIIKYIIKRIPTKDMKKICNEGGLYQETPLYYAYTNNNEQMVKELLSVDPSAIHVLNNKEQQRLKILLYRNPVSRQIQSNPIPMFGNFIGTDIIERTFSNLSPQDLKKCLRVSRIFYEFAKNVDAWRVLAIKKFGQDTVDNKRKKYLHASWFELYRNLITNKKLLDNIDVQSYPDFFNFEFENDQIITAYIDGQTIVFKDNYGKKAEIKIQYMIHDVFLCLHNLVVVDVFSNAYTFHQNNLQKLLNDAHTESLIQSYQYGDTCKWWCNFINQTVPQIEETLRKNFKTKKIIYENYPNNSHNIMYPNHVWIEQNENNTELHITYQMLFCIGVMGMTGEKLELSELTIKKFQSVANHNAFSYIMDLYKLDPRNSLTNGNLDIVELFEKIKKVEEMFSFTQKNILDLFPNVRLTLETLKINKEGLIQEKRYNRTTKNYDNEERQLFDKYRNEIPNSGNIQGTEEELQLYQDGSVIWLLYKKLKVVNAQVIRKPIHTGRTTITTRLSIKCEINAILKSMNIKIPWLVINNMTNYINNLLSNPKIDKINISLIRTICIAL
jgi:hypothetical protein